jgi:hypothetical protein
MEGKGIHRLKIIDMNQQKGTLEETLKAAVELAVRENAMVSFPCSDDNDVIRATILHLGTDLRGCQLLKRTKEDTAVNVWPPTLFGYLF